MCCSHHLPLQVMASDLVGCNLSVLLTTSGRLIPGTEVTLEDIALDVYVTPQELCHHEAAIEEAVSILTQILIAKMAIPHCHEVRCCGTLYGFVKENSNPHWILTLPCCNPWPTPPVPYTDLSQKTHQTIPSWPPHAIGDCVLPFLKSVFPAVACPSHGSGTDAFKTYHIPNVSTQVSYIKGHAVQHLRQPSTHGEEITLAARAAEEAAQDQCHSISCSTRAVQQLEHTLAKKCAALEGACMQAMELSCHADEALSQQLVYHHVLQHVIEETLQAACETWAAMMLSIDSTLTPSTPPLPPAKPSPVASPSITMNHRNGYTPKSTPRVSRILKSPPKTPTVPSAILRAISPSTSLEMLTNSRSHTGTSMPGEHSHVNSAYLRKMYLDVGSGAV